MSERITLAHGAGGRLSHRLIDELIEPALDNELLRRMDDSAVLDLSGPLAFTTDSYVVDPLEFPGGDIGRLAVCGTVNDLAMVGAEPRYISLAFILEEGLELDLLKRILKSIAETAAEAGVSIVTGDTKVVNRGGADKMFVNTAGLGAVRPGLDISAGNCRPGDAVIVSGTIGDHGATILSSREGIGFGTTLESDSAPLNGLVARMLEACPEVSALRDPTRGGLSSTLNEFAAQSGVGIKLLEEALPIREAVRGACELLGLDPLILANEGKLIAVCPADAAEGLVAAMRRERYGEDATVIGEVLAEPAGKVFVETGFGTHRILDMPVGEQMPRIC